MDLSLRRESFGADDQSWRATRTGTDDALSITLDRSAFTKATHYPDNFLKSGTPLAKITATGLYGPYQGSATDGRGTAAGFLLGPVPFPKDSDADPVAALQWHGAVNPARVPGGIDADGRADLSAHFAFVGV